MCGKQDSWRRRKTSAICLLWILFLTVSGYAQESEVRESLSREIQTTQETATEAALERGGEVFHFKWRLGGFIGILAGLFVPDDGDALLSFVPVPERGMIAIELLITADGREGEYFLYGAEVDKDSGSTVSVWSSQVFRGERKDREQEVTEEDVIDFASVLYHLRRSPPSDRTPVTIWNSGKFYPVAMEPLGVEKRKVYKQKADVKGFAVRGVEIDGKSSFKDKLFLYFLDDEESTPAQIVGKRGGIRIKASLVGHEAS